MTKTTINIVEDEMIIARELAARLNVLGYEVANIASSKQEALQQVSTRQPDLVFMDIVLKGSGDGIETALTGMADGIVFICEAFINIFKWIFRIDR